MADELSGRTMRFTAVAAWLGLLGDNPAEYIAANPEAAEELLDDIAVLKDRSKKTASFNHVMDLVAEAAGEGRWEDATEALRRSLKFA